MTGTSPEERAQMLAAVSIGDGGITPLAGRVPPARPRQLATAATAPQPTAAGQGRRGHTDHLWR
jgi:hypothetical protein